VAEDYHHQEKTLLSTPVLKFHRMHMAQTHGGLVANPGIATIGSQTGNLLCFDITGLSWNFIATTANKADNAVAAKQDQFCFEAILLYFKLGETKIR